MNSTWSAANVYSWHFNRICCAWKHLRHNVLLFSWTGVALLFILSFFFLLINITQKNCIWYVFSALPEMDLYGFSWWWFWTGKSFLDLPSISVNVVMHLFLCFWTFFPLSCGTAEEEEEWQQMNSGTSVLWEIGAIFSSHRLLAPLCWESSRHRYQSWCYYINYFFLVF